MTGPYDLQCRGCGNTLRHTFLDLGIIPLCQSYVAPENVEHGETLYPLHARLCPECFYVGLPEYVSAASIFTEYAYFSSYSDSWMQYIKASAEAMMDEFRLGAGSQVVEMASNDGYLLQHFIAKGIPALGVEPAVNVARVANEKGIPTLAKFFNSTIARSLCEQGISADLLLAYNCLDHVPDVNDVVAGMKLLLKPRGVIHVELPHLRCLVEGNQFDTIYHDRFSYFSFTSLHQIFRRQGLQIFDVEEISTHGGSLRIRACHVEDTAVQRSPRVQQTLISEERCGMKSLAYYADFAQRVTELKHALLGCLLQLKRAGKSIVGYGVPAKGNVLLNYCGVRSDLLDYVVDRSPYKQGKYTPGTRIPIRPVDQVARTRPDYLLILPWNIKEEVMNQMAYIRDWGGRFIVPVPSVQVL